MLNPREVWDQAFLDVRSMLLEIAATLDRYDDALRRLGDLPPEYPGDDPRVQMVYESLRILLESPPQSYRTERLLELFSDTT